MERRLIVWIRRREGPAIEREKGGGGGAAFRKMAERGRGGLARS